MAYSMDLRKRVVVAAGQTVAVVARRFSVSRATVRDWRDRAQREDFTISRRLVDPEKLVFLDESSAKTNMTRLYGWSPVGQRCLDHTPHGHGQTTTMLGVIRLDGVMQDATRVLDGPMNGAVFLGYVHRCLVPSLRPGDGVVMDNLASHKVTGVVEAIRSAGAKLCYLPPYWPDLNPIEKLWSKVKAWLRRVAAQTYDALIQAIADALRAVDPTECTHYFESCGTGYTLYTSTTTRVIDRVGYSRGRI